MSPTTESTPGKDPATLPDTPTTGDSPSGELPPKRHRELFRMLLAVLKDPERAYTVSEEIMSTAGENVVAQIGARLDVQMARTNARIDGLSARLDEQVARINARIDGLSARLDEQVARINARIDGLSARLDALETIVARMDARLERLENQWSRLIWGFLGLQTALVVAILTLVFRG